MEKSKSFIKCEKGHRAQKVPGEKNTYFCSECELKITSGAKPYYPSQYENKNKKHLRKKVKPSAKSKPLKGPQLKEVLSCSVCSHRIVCHLIVGKPNIDRTRNVCSCYSYGN